MGVQVVQVRPIFIFVEVLVDSNLWTSPTLIFVEVPVDSHLCTSPISMFVEVIVDSHLCTSPILIFVQVLVDSHLCTSYTYICISKEVLFFCGDQKNMITKHMFSHCSLLSEVEKLSELTLQCIYITTSQLFNRLYLVPAMATQIP